MKGNEIFCFNHNTSDSNNLSFQLIKYSIQRNTFSRLDGEFFKRAILRSKYTPCPHPFHFESIIIIYIHKNTP